MQVFAPAVFAPRRIPETQPFWEACRRGKLMLSRCKACGERYFCAERACPRCHSTEQDWVEATGKGILYSYVICHRSNDAAGDGIAPVIAIIQLHEGPRIMSYLTGLERAQDELRIGMAVEVTFSDMEGRDYPFSFRPVSQS